VNDSEEAIGAEKNKKVREGNGYNTWVGASKKSKFL
jgi:hypothetical protein